MSLGKAETGIILFFVSTLTIIILIFVGLFQPYIYTFSFTNQGIYGFYFGTTFVSLMLFVSDRIGFVRRMNGNKFVSALMIVLGLHLAVPSLFIAFFSLYFRYFGELIIFLLLTGLTFILGLLWVFYGFEIRRYELYTDSNKKYPKDLLLKYAQLYSYPSEVLERQIQKKMNEGKTREQAIEELTEETQNL